MVLKSSFPVLLTFFLVFSSCKDIPRQQLDASQRKADMLWVTSKIETEYAPLEYKQDLFNFDYQQLKEEYLAKAEKEQTNEEFYQLLNQFVAYFKDAHMSGTVSQSHSMGRSRVAHLGFNVKRRGDFVVVTGLLPTYKGHEKQFPIDEGDLIVAIDGMPIKEAIDKRVTPYRDLGNPFSNYTALAQRLFRISSVSQPLPTKPTATITVAKRVNGEVVAQNIVLPWVIKDFAQFSKEQAEASKKKSKLEKSELHEVKTLLEFAMSNPYVTEGQLRAYIQSVENYEEFKLNFMQLFTSFHPGNSFELQTDQGIDQFEKLTKLVEEKFSGEASTPIQRLAKERYILPQRIPIEQAKSYPAYIGMYTDDDGKRHRVGYMRIGTFSGVSENDALKEVQQTIQAFRDYTDDVKHVVLDLVGNGGGSLSLGLKMAQMFSHSPLQPPLMRTRLNDSWVDNFERRSQQGNDTTRTMARSVYQQMMRGIERGDKLSTLFSVHFLYPFQLNANTDLRLGEEVDFNMLILADETCASMCDIFTSMMKENNKAKVMGMKTVGAGGNVVNHHSAPNSGFQLRITESLILSPSGVYLENNGVDPDFVHDFTADTSTHFATSLRAAFKKVVELGTPEPEPETDGRGRAIIRAVPRSANN